MEKQRVYVIPKNYADSGKILKGMFYTRNIVEAVVVSVLLGKIETFLFPFGMTIQIIIVVLTCVPIFVVGCIGIRGYSLLQYVMIFMGYMKNKRKLKYRRILKRMTKADMERMIKQGMLKKPRKIAFNKSALPILNKSKDEEIDDENEGNKDFNDQLKSVYESVVPQNLRMNKSKQHFVQELIPIKKVESGIIQTRDNRYIKILEITPSNMQGLSDEDINSIGTAFEEWLRIAPQKVQMKVITQKKTEFEYIEGLKRIMDNEKIPEARKMIMNYIRHIKETTQRNGIARRAFLIFQYEKAGIGNNEIHDIYAQIYTRVEMTRQIFGRMGNNVVDTINSEYDVFVMQLLYDLLNRKSSLKESYANREKRVRQDMAKIKKKNPIYVLDKIPVLDLISPRGVDLSHPDYVIIDGMYTTYYAVDASSYPVQCFIGWTNLFINCGEGFDVDIFVEKEDTEKALERIQTKLYRNQAGYNDTQAASTRHDFMEEVIQSGYFIKEQLAKYGDSLYQTVILITITAKELKALELKKTQIKSVFKTQSIGYLDFKHQMEDCFLSTLPLCNLERTIYEKNKRNMLTQSVASMYPYSSYELSDKTGIAIGIAENGSVAYMNLFNNALLDNANMFVVGSPGSGKTYTILTMATRMRLMQIKTIMIAPFKGYEFKRACKAVGGSFIKISLKSKDCINVMDIITVETEYSNYDGDEEERNLLAEKIDSVIAFLRLIHPDMTNKQSILLDRVIRKTYEKKGIYLDDVNSIYANGKNGDFKQMPILGDLKEEVAKYPELDDLDNALEQYVSGSKKCFNQQTNVDINNKFTVIDVSELSEEMLAVGMFIAISFSSENIEADRTKQKAIYFDEAWRVLKDETDRSGIVGDYVQKTVKIIRGMGGAAIFATQDIKDLTKNKKAQSIISACHSKLILHMEKSEALLAQDVVGMTDDEVQLVVKAKKGYGLLCAGRNRIVVHIKASDKEHELFTTSQQDLEAIEKRRKQKRMQQEAV